MKKIIVELLEQYEKDMDMPQHELTFYTDERIISKHYGFIKWLVDNDKIDRTYREDIDYPFYIDDTIKELKGYKRDEMIIMLLAIQDEPIEFLISILK